MALFGAIMGGLSIISGISSANSQKKRANKQAKIQKEKVEQQYKFNKKETEDTFFNNTEVNFTNIADSMFTLTQDYITKNSEASFNASIMSGGVIFNSSRNDTKNALKINYTDAMTQLTSERVYNERTLYNTAINSLTQLEIDRQAELNGIESAKSTAHSTANQNIINSITSGVGSIYSSLGAGNTTHETSTNTSGNISRGLQSTRAKKGIRK